MALIKCGECGRAVSEQASACPGCGAPVHSPTSAFNLVPEREVTRLFSATRLRWHALLALLLIVAGGALAVATEHAGGVARAGALLAALLIIVGLCWALVIFVQSRSVQK